MDTQTTLIIAKPDALQRALTGQIIARFEAKGLKLVAAKLINVPEATAKQHYAEHDGKPFFPDLIKFITSSPVLVMAVRGRNAVAACRKVIGSTDGANAEPGTLRGDFGISKSLNLVHGSDSPESAERELAIWFQPDEILDYPRNIDQWIDS